MKFSDILSGYCNEQLYKRYVPNNVEVPFIRNKTRVACLDFLSLHKALKVICLDAGKTYFNERCWYGKHRTKVTRKRMIFSHDGDRYWYPCSVRKGSNKYDIGENRRK